ncbi:carbon-nitrogen hydrolase [Mycena leptocephala]|nr:carbon-nitrogen hydrolase [Mycena leptocephala]
MPVPRLSPRIAMVQFQPKQVAANMAKARELCRGSIDLVCLPEMVFSGYVFENAAAIGPYLEHPRTGPTSAFCAELAQHLNAMSWPVEEYLAETGGRVVGANSATLYGPDGEWVGGYRKTNLFSTTRRGQARHDRIRDISLPPPLRSVTLSICMDLNAQPPHSWTTADDKCLVLLNAWIDSAEDPDDRHDMYTVDFWAERLRPLWLESSSASQETFVVVCNRGGDENGKTFAGSSAVFRMRQGGGKSGILRAALSREDEDVMVWDSST